MSLINQCFKNNPDKTSAFVCTLQYTEIKCNRPDAWPWVWPGEAKSGRILHFINPPPSEGPVTLRSALHCQAAYQLSLVLVLIYVYWHAISCSITFTCHSVNQQGCTVMGGNSIGIAFCPYWLIWYISTESVTVDEQRTSAQQSCYPVMSALWTLVHHTSGCVAS